MANPCNNHIVIKTSVDPNFFLVPPTDENCSDPDKQDLVFELQEVIMPFSSKSESRAWGTSWFVCDHCELKETITTEAPPEPTPIIITQGTRRYPVLQKMPFVPYTYSVWDISGDSAYEPPLGYLTTLYWLLKKIDPRTTIDCWYYEAGNGILGHWYSGTHQHVDAPQLFWSDTLDGEVIYEMNEFQSQVLSHFIDIDELIPYEEAMQRLTSREDLREIREYFEESISKQCENESN